MKKTCPERSRRIIVTGAGGFASVGFCRNLIKAREKYYLIGTDTDPFKILFANTQKKYLIPRANSQSYLKVLNIIIEKNKVDFLHAQTDTEIAAIAKIKNRLKTRTFLPKLKTIKLAQNKLKTQQILEKKQVPVPPSILIKNKKDIKKAFQSLGKSIWFRTIKGAGGKGSLLIKDKKIAASWIEHWRGFGDFMACQYLPGKNIGWDSIWFNGRLVISHTKERLSYAKISSSPSGITGTAGAIKSVKRKKVDEICQRTILAISKKPHGVFAIDLKEDENGQPFVTEINPGRFLTSSLHFFAETGYNLPNIFVKLGFGEKVDLNLKYPAGTYMIRSLDAEPILFNEQYMKKVAKGLRKKPFFELK